MDPAEDSNPKEAVEITGIPGLPPCKKIYPLTEWVRRKDEEEGEDDSCVPCDLAAIAPLYRTLLEEKGYNELAAKVDALGDGEPTNLEIAAVLDEVRESVNDEAVKRQLLSFDCMMQQFEEKGGEV